jgi:hypothetical protein
MVLSRPDASRQRERRPTKYRAARGLTPSTFGHVRLFLSALLWRTGILPKVLSKHKRKARKKHARKDEIIARKDENIARKDEIIARKNEIIARKNDRVARNNQIIERNNRKIERKTAKLTAKLDAIVRESREQQKNIRRLFANSPADWTPAQRLFLLRALRSVDLLSERDLHFILNNLFSQREREMIFSIVNDDSMGFDLVRECYRLRLNSESWDESVSLDTIAELYTRTRRSFLHGRILREFLVKAVKVGAVDQIETALSELNDREFDRISRSTLMGISRLFIQRERYDVAALVLSKYLKPEREDQLLYFLESLLELDKVGALRGGLHEFCQQFQPVSSASVLEHLKTAYKTVDDVDRHNFQHLVIEPLSALSQDERNLMDVRFLPQQRRAFSERIKCSIVEAKPLSLIRLGDGEAYPYPAPQVDGIEPTLFETDNRAFERRWWGAAPPIRVREDLTARIRQAVARCDILGFPSVYRIIRDLPPPHHRYGKNRNQRALIRLFYALGGSIPVEHKWFTEERCHRCAIDAAFVTEVAAMARSVVVVSCWPGIEANFPAASVQAILVPPAKYLRHPPLGNGMPALFDVYEEIVERVRLASAPGTVVFVGAGIIGKIFVDEARQAGAVALDIGSLLDYMAGFKTRSIADVI